MSTKCLLAGHFVSCRLFLVACQPVWSRGRSLVTIVGLLFIGLLLVGIDDMLLSLSFTID